MIVRVKQDIRPSNLTPGREYIVLGLDHFNFCVLNDRCEPILYEKQLFEVTDPSIPDDWVWERFSDDEYYADPPETMARGFYERYFDGDPEAVATFRKFLERIGLTPEGQKKDK